MSNREIRVEFAVSIVIRFFRFSFLNNVVYFSRKSNPVRCIISRWKNITLVNPYEILRLLLLLKEIWST